MIDNLDTTIAELTPVTEAQLEERFAHWDDVGFAPPPLVVWEHEGTTYLVDGRCRLRYAQSRGCTDTLRFAFRNFVSREAAVEHVWECARNEGKRLSDLQVKAGRALSGLPIAGAHSRSIRETLAAPGGREALDRVLRGECGLTTARRDLGLVKARAPRGPQQPPADKYSIAEGHELERRSALTKDGVEVAAWDKGRIARDDPAPPPPDFAVQRVSVGTGAGGTEFARWTAYEQSKADAFAKFEAAVKSVCETYVRPAEPLRPPDARWVNEELASFYCLGDPHMGLLSWGRETGGNHDLAIGVRELETCVDTLVSLAPASAVAYLCNMGDYFHAETDAQRTPRSGAKLDVDTRHGKVYDAGLALQQRMHDRLLEKHGRVVSIQIPGNHDPHSAHQIASFVRAWYREEPRVEVRSPHNPMVFETFGNTLVALCHGDGAKIDKIPSIVANRAREAWGKTKFHLAITGHVHHLQRKEYPGCVVETVRTLAANDYWHHAEGYDSGKSLSVLTLHKRYGEYDRKTCDRLMVLDLLGDEHKESVTS